MKRQISMILAVFLLLTCMLPAAPKAYAAAKASETRTIGIVFDNSGSMYDSGDQAWCRATYAMEVFASMMNQGDNLYIYPMSPIIVRDREYTMDNPFRLTEASQASQIREILTPDAGGTPIESIDCAAESLKAMRVENKYLIVLTDGGTFSKNDTGMSKERTKKELDNRFQSYAGEDMTVMYLGIGADACDPSTPQSEFFVKKLARDTAAVLSSLTDMCNLVFGRDSLPKNHIYGDTVDFDISMSKLIVFVQGDSISDLKLTDASGASVGQPVSTQQTMYSTVGAGDYKCAVDDSLQGMMVTYADVDPGTYTIAYTGTPTSVEVYYEPDADLDFVFTDAEGNNVDPNALYDGDYKVSFGIKDAKTGQMISSDLLGSPQYQGYYSINGQQVPISHSGHSGEVPVTLNMNDAFDAKMTVTYLSGYTITKSSADFGWPADGIQVASRPAGELQLEISGGQSSYSLQDLEKEEPFIAKVYHQGQQLTGEELNRVDLKWDPDTSNAEITKEFADDHWKLHLEYKDPSAPETTVCGPCTVTIYAHYAAKGCAEAQTEDSLTYDIKDDFSPFQADLHAPEDYIVISKLDSSKAITVSLTLNGQKLTAEDFAATSLDVDTSGIEYTLTPSEKDSAYQIKLLSTAGIAEGDYPVRVTARYTDHIGRVSETEERTTITLSNVPLWVRWTVSLLLLLIAIILLLIILHIKVLPKYAHVNKKNCRMIFDDEDESTSTTFYTKIEKGRMVIKSKFAGSWIGLSMDVVPGKESYLRNPQARRYAEVKPNSVKASGPATIQDVTIGGVKYQLNEDTKKLERVPKSDKPFMLRHGMTITYTGTMMNAGSAKPFAVNAKLNFKKK